jgi:SAM-dependent methyltransferase
MSTEQPRCPICGGIATLLMLRTGVPVHQNLRYATAETARGTTRGDIALHYCTVCGFTFNASFDPRLLDYGPDYENDQTGSPAFADHIADRIERILATCGARGGQVVEVGCGAGTFLTRLVSHPNSTFLGIGVDPAYRGAPRPIEGRVRFRSAPFAPDEVPGTDVIVCRHVIEHIHDPASFLAELRACSTSDRTHLFVETPAAEWITEHRVAWDIFYEHCSLFSATSLERAVTDAGFAVTAVDRVFEGQYLWAEAVAHDGPRTAPLQTPEDIWDHTASAWGTASRWRGMLLELQTAGPIAVWGAGAKATTFCELADPMADTVACVIDINPAKKGGFVPGTGHPIVAPVRAREVATVVVLNPNYVDEIAEALSTINPDARTVNLMNWAP